MSRRRGSWSARCRSGGTWPINLQRGVNRLRPVRTEPVLLVHGFASSFDRNWREPGWADLLSEAGRQVIGIDLLGHGSADKPHDPAAYAHLHESLIAALPEEGPADAVGVSVGARLGLNA